MRILKRSFLTALLALSLLSAPRAGAQGFGFDDAPDSSDASFTARKSPVTASGELTLGGVLFLDDLDNLAASKPGNSTEARLNLILAGAAAEAGLRLRIGESALGAGDPAAFLEEAVDEAWLRLFFGPLTVEGGILKVSWGKADSQGPLDVLNPYDLTDLTVLDTMERKIAQLMLRTVVSLGGMSKLEAVFLPYFEGHDIALTGKWAPAQAVYLSAFSQPDTSNLDYAQTGLRFSTTSGSVDWGLQYFYGNLPTPALNIPANSILYNRYHQIGADLAAVAAGLNLRAELAGNITEDLDGDDPSVYNPALAFSLGADRDLAARINLNLQYAGAIRLADKGIASPPDFELGTDAFRSTLTATAFQKLFWDKLEWRLTILWGVSDADFLVVPGLTWIEGDAALKLAAGIFGGDSAGQLGQYRDSGYLKLTMTYTF